jgi:glycosyltransferase involved in cell wall biosynthesis
LVSVSNSHNSSRIQRLLWIEPSHFDLDKSLHKHADLEVAKELAKQKTTTYLMVMESKRYIKVDFGFSKLSSVSIPIKRFPLISPVLYALSQLFYLPYYLIKLSPNAVMVAPDVSVISCIPSLLVAKLKKIKFILDIRSVPVELQGFRGFLQEFWFSVSLIVGKRFFDGVTTITPLMKADLSGQFNLDAQKIGVWTSGVSTDLFDAKTHYEKGQNLKAKLGLSDKFVVFYHGAFSTTRGLIETVKAFKEIKTNQPSIVLFLLGTGPALTILKDLVQKEALQENVVIQPPVSHSEVPPYIALADVCIIPLPNYPHWRSQSPLKLLEYLSMEKPVILTDIPAHLSVVSQAPCGIFMHSTDPHEIANTVLETFKNKEKLFDWGRTGKKIITENYTWEKVASNLNNYLVKIQKKSN